MKRRVMNESKRQRATSVRIFLDRYKEMGQGEGELDFANI